MTLYDIYIMSLFFDSKDCLILLQRITDSDADAYGREMDELTILDSQRHDSY
jgi:hypothetical protein